ncbi:MAG: LptF/LptG family permease [Bacteroidales bacterium]|nr:LptF/LptG family permease [Bacteroidales bacterium]MBR5532276.1 LptF/LptG family permease [Bacteroidales bacterium]
MLKKIDFYIIKKFLGTYVFAIVLIISIAVVFDINEKIDDFINAPLKEIIFDYYLNFIPYYTNLFSQLFTFIAVIFFTSKLADNSEIIAMLSSGISFKRLMIPYMVSAAIISSLTFTLNSFVIPPANKTRIEFQNKYVSNKKVDYAANVQLQVSPGVIAYINRYDDNLKTGYRFSMEKFEGKSLRSKLTAESIRYDSAYHWVARNYTIRDFDGMEEKFQKGNRLDTIITIAPSDFLISRYDAELMTTPELKQYIKKQEARGASNIKPFQIEYETRIASTFAAFILTSIGMFLSSRKVKGGMGVNIGIGLVLSFTYILFSSISSTFATNGDMSPRLAVWLPNIIYMIIAVYLYRKAPK